MRGRRRLGRPGEPADGEKETVDAAPGIWSPDRRALTAGLLLTITLVASEALAVVTIMPQVVRQLGGIHLYGWAFSAFLLGSMVGIVAAGREADRSGPARPYVAGLVLFSAGLLVGGLAPSMQVLVVGRTLQGLGAGAVPAVAYVTIGRSYPEGLRARMMAMMSTAWVVPGLVGPLASAAVAHAFGWRWVFVGLVPLVAVTGTLALPGLGRLATETGPDAPAAEHRIVDAVRTAAGTAVLVAGLGAGNPLVAVLLLVVGAAVLAPALVRLLPAGTLRARPGLPATILLRGLLTFSFFGADAFVTLAIVTVRHQGVGVAGVAVTCATMAWTIGAWVQARLHRVWEGRRLVQVGLTLIMAGTAGMIAVLRPSTPIAIAFVGVGARRARHGARLRARLPHDAARGPTGA